MFGFIKARRDRKAAEIAAFEKALAAAIAATHRPVSRPATTTSSSSKGWGIYSECYTWDVACMQKVAREHSLREYEASKYRSHKTFGRGNGD